MRAGSLKTVYRLHILNSYNMEVTYSILRIWATKSILRYLYSLQDVKRYIITLPNLRYTCDKFDMWFEDLWSFVHDDYFSCTQVWERLHELVVHAYHSEHYLNLELSSWAFFVANFKYMTSSYLWSDVEPNSASGYTWTFSIILS